MTLTRDLLDDLKDFLDNYVDVVDGEDGQPAPNRAMRLRDRLDEVMPDEAHLTTSEQGGR